MVALNVPIGQAEAEEQIDTLCLSLTDESELTGERRPRTFA